MAKYVVIAFVIAAALGPALWIVISSFKTGAQINTGESPLIPNPVTFQGYLDLTQIELPKYLANTAIYAIGAAALSPLLAALAAYPCTRMRFPFRGSLTLAISAALAVPAIGLIVPEFFILLRMGLLDTKVGMLLFYTAIFFPLAFVILRAYLVGLPSEVEEAATVDGAGYFTTLFTIILPLSRPALATVAVIVFVGVWNDFLWNTLLAPGFDNRNVQVALAGFRSRFEYNVSAVLAGSTVVMLVPIVMFVLLQRQVIAGLTRGYGK
jgi:raffinose/stachyose/melibiose transport system permease protein